MSEEYEEYDEALKSFRPSLVKLTEDGKELQQEFLSGFDGRREVVEWMQKAGVYTLGELPDVFISDLQRQFRHPEHKEGVFLAVLLKGLIRTRDVSDESAEQMREYIVSDWLQPAQARAFMRLRNRATEYVQDAQAGDEHDPARQRFIAMRPSLDELHHHQSETLNEFLDGFESGREVLEWANDIPLASHGEMDTDVLRRMMREEGTLSVLIGDSESDARTRELLAVTYLLPAYLAGVRDMTGRATEQPDSEGGEMRVAQG